MLLSLKDYFLLMDINSRVEIYSTILTFRNYSYYDKVTNESLTLKNML